jgi:ethanolamine utilization protein EutA
MANAVTLIGLDFGTTTSSAIVASARLVRNSVRGRCELSEVQERYRSDIVFTPFHRDRLDLERITELLDSWLTAGAVRPEEVFGGGALLTGLGAQQGNAGSLVAVIRERLHGAVIAAADDPCLEAWLAFMGSCAALSREFPLQPVLNLDIGGGTTNLALGRAGEVLRTGCLLLGARHIQVEPGTYRIVRLSSYARALLDHLHISDKELTVSALNAVLAFYLRLLKAAVMGDAGVFEEPVARLHQQMPLSIPANAQPAIVTLSGGVGKLIYAHLRGEPWPATTCFGDLGIDLARRIVDSGLWAVSLRTYIPAGGGRATVFGLLHHATSVSGSTTFLSDPHILPLSDLPIVGGVTDSSSEVDLRAVLYLAQRSLHGAAVRVTLADGSSVAVRDLGQRIGQALAALHFPPMKPLVFFLTANLGKVLGNYVTDWGATPRRLVVVDEIAVPDAHYVQIGCMQDQVLPVSFFGLEPNREKA